MSPVNARAGVTTRSPPRSDPAPAYPAIDAAQTTPGRGLPQPPRRLRRERRLLRAAAVDFGRIDVSDADAHAGIDEGVARAPPATAPRWLVLRGHFS